MECKVVDKYLYGNKSVGLIMNERGKMHVRKYELVSQVFVDGLYRLVIVLMFNN